MYDWKDIFKKYSKEKFDILVKRVNYEYDHHRVYPPKDLMFSCFRLTPFEDVKVVILGQDPYHQAGQANGLAFSVGRNVKIPPSLRNIYKELNSDLGVPIREDGNLVAWARQGVLLLNASLTVIDSRPNSHSKLGWQEFTDFLISMISKYRENVVFILWGNFARSKARLIDQSKHLIIESVHPSPLSASRGFFGSKPFSRTNDYLISHGKTPIDWSK